MTIRSRCTDCTSRHEALFSGQLRRFGGVINQPELHGAFSRLPTRYLDVYAGVASTERHDGMGAQARFVEARERYAKLPRATLLRTTSVRAAKQWQGKLDLVFIDAEHDFASCDADIAAWAPLVSGFVAGHDYRFGEPGVPDAVHAHLPQTADLHIAPGGVWWWRQ